MAVLVAKVKSVLKREAIFFTTPADFRRWLSTNHENTPEVWVGFYKKDSGRPSITWPQSVDEALCVGLIDGLRQTIDPQSYRIRFTPRKPTSNWSAVNIGRVQELTRQGRMRPAGLKAFALRVEKKSGIYAYENRHAAVLSEPAEQKFRTHPAAWEFFQRQPAGYRMTTIWWVMSGRREETRQRRLETLIADSAARRRIGALTRPAR